MPVTVSIPTPLRGFTSGRDTVELAGETVGQVLEGLLAAHTGLKRAGPSGTGPTTRRGGAGRSALSTCPLGASLGGAARR